jgi:alpha-L-fucosidase
LEAGNGRVQHNRRWRQGIVISSLLSCRSCRGCSSWQAWDDAFERLDLGRQFSRCRAEIAVLDLERGQLGGIRPLPWQTDTSISDKSWGYIQNDTFKSPEFVIHQLIDVVSKNGNLLLNIGPRPDGTIPQEVQQVLLEVGAWLKVNGEAIYGTRPWKVFGEGPTKVAAGAFHDTETRPYTAEDVRFTRRNDTLYALQLGWPENHEAVIHTLTPATLDSGKHVQSIQLLGSEGNLEFEQLPDGLHIQLPDHPVGKYAYALRIDFKNSR